MCQRMACTAAVLVVAACFLGRPADARGPGVLLRAVVPRSVPQDPALAPMPVATVPGPYRYPQYKGGNYPWYGYGFGVPTYQWGYFGAEYRPASISHHGYYGDFTQWGYRRGY